MSASIASPHLLSSLIPQTVAFCKSIYSSPSLISFSSSFKLHSKPPLLSFASVSVLGASLPRFVPQVAVSSDFEQNQNEEAVDGGSVEEQQNFPLDLKLFVGNLPFSVDSSALAELFQNAGEVQMVEVIYDKVTQRSRGFGFVTMSSMEEVKVAAEKFNGYELDGRPLRVNFGPPPPRSENQYSGGSSFDDSNRLYVGNLSWAVDDLALQTLFSEQGKVMEARVVYDRESGRSRGFGFVTYSSAEEVTNAIQSLDGFDLSGRQIRVSMAEARPPRRQF